jgi:hypothetical protein
MTSFRSNGSMRLPATLMAIALSFFVVAVVPGSETASTDFHIFYGEVTALDLAAKTITIKSGGKSFVFQVTPETKISSFNRFVRLDTIKRGEAAAITMRVGEHGRGVAVKIRLSSDATNARITALFSAKTIEGETISGVAVANYVVYEPPDEAFGRGLDFGNMHASMFLLTVQRDGTVSAAKPLGTLGYEELNERAARWAKHWKFRPNSLTEVRMPIVYRKLR